MQKTIYWFIAAIVVAVIVVVIALAIRGSRQDPTSPTGEQSTSTAVFTHESEATESGETEESISVIVTEDGFYPANLTVKKGTAVRFINQGNEPHFVASNPHPVHTDLPEFQSGNFGPNESFTFTFEKAGAWGYHDHLNPTVRGTITVTE